MNNAFNSTTFLIKLFKLNAQLILIVILIGSCKNSENSDIGIFKEDKYSSPPEFLGEPPSNAGTSLIKEQDGSISFIYRPGDWDYEGFSDTVFFMNTKDEGRNWSKPSVLAVTGPGSQCFSTISPVTGEIIIFFIRRETGT